MPALADAGSASAATPSARGRPADATHQGHRYSVMSAGRCSGLVAHNENAVLRDRDALGLVVQAGSGRANTTAPAGVIAINAFSSEATRT